jgi:hypothetical protein
MKVIHRTFQNQAHFMDEEPVTSGNGTGESPRTSVIPGQALDQTASAQGLSLRLGTADQNIVRRMRGSRRTPLPTGVLTHEYRTTQPIIAMGHRVEQGFTDRGFVKSRNVVPEQTLLIALSIIAEIDAFPERILKKEEPFPELGAILRGAGCFGRAVLEDDFRLRQIPAGACRVPSRISAGWLGAHPRATRS